MKNQLQWSKISRLNYLMITSFILLFILICFYTLYELRNSLINTRKHEISAVLSIAKHYSIKVIERQQAGELTREEAENQVIQFLSSLRDGKSRYLWANDNHAIARVHVRKNVIGRFQKSYTRDMALLLEQDPAFIVTTNVKPVDNVRVIKINGVTKIPVWNWTVGFGIYMDDFYSEYWTYAVRMILAYAALMTLFLVILWLLFRKRDNGAS